MWPQKSNVSSAESSGLSNVRSIKPEVGQNIALHALRAARGICH